MPHARPPRIEIGVRAAAMAFVVIAALSRWDATTGFTAIPRFGEQFAATRIPELRALPLYNSRGPGYDGQWYATLAANPRVTDSTVIAALDKPAYRARRILVPLVAHVAAAGDPWRAIQIFVALHVAAWVVLAAILLWRLFPVGDWRATAAWCAALLGTGMLDSLRMTLTDLPAAALLVAALMAVERGRTRAAAVLLLAAGFVRELSLAALLALRRAGSNASGGRDAWFLRGAVAFPVIAWCLWLAWRIPGGAVGYEGNISWPAQAFVSGLAANLAGIARGDYDNQRIFGVLGGIGLAAQSFFVLRRWKRLNDDRWIALAIPFAVLFWIIGADPWADYRAVARDCLPMTIGFAVVWWRTRASAWWLLAQLPVVADGLLRTTWPNG